MGLGVLLLDHIRRAFEERDTDRLPTAELIRLLVANEEGPWGKWWGAETNRDGAPRAAAADVARYLKGFGVRPHVIKMPDGSTARGYSRETLEESWTLYLPPVTNVTPVTLQPARLRPLRRLRPPPKRRS